MNPTDFITHRGGTPARRALILCAVGLACWLVSTYAHAQVPAPGGPTNQTLIKEIIIQGNKGVTNERILGFIRTRPGSYYNAEQLKKDTEALLATKLFSNAEVRYQSLPNNQVNVYFVVNEYSNVIREVIFKNARHLSQTKLEELTELKAGMPLNPAQVHQARTNLLQYYKESGRYFTTVVIEEGASYGDTRVVMNISEGPVVKVSSITFTGNQFASSARLKTQIESGTPVLMLFGGVFDPRKIEIDLLKLNEYYKGNGFHEIQVKVEPIFHNRDRQVQLVYHVHEGPRYKVKDIQVDSKLFDQKRLRDMVQLQPDQYYDQHKVDADKERMKQVIGYQGHRVPVTEEVVQEGNGFVRVRYEVQDPRPNGQGEMKPDRVNQVIPIGNDVTKDRVIRRMLNLYPGQILYYPELQIAANELKRLNIFENDPDKGGPPVVEVIDNDTGSEFKDVIVRVKETPTGSLLFGLGVNSDAGLVGSIVLNERNFDILRPPTSWDDIFDYKAFRGGGQELRLEAVPGTQLQRYSATFREPFLFDRPYSLGVSAYFFERSYNEYLEEREGGRFTLGHQFNRNWSASTTLRIENVNVSQVSIFAPPAYTSVEGNNFQILPGFKVTYDTRDSFLKPTQGEVVNVAYEQGLGEFTFPLVNIDASKYFTIWQRPDGSGKNVLAFRTVLGFAGSNTPVYERFFAGGFQSLRGFAFRGVGPEVAGFKVGGDFMWLNSVEYQIPVRANDQLYFVTFLDTGTVESNVSIRDYRVAAGVGARIIVPALGPVPIALDFGFPIVQAPNDNRQLFSFWVGLFR
jgi:outer membrane protein assembly complex protein YaeT